VTGDALFSFEISFVPVSVEECAASRRESLAHQRAENAKAYLVDRHAIDSSRITTATDLNDRTNRGKAVIVVTFNP